VSDPWCTIPENLKKKEGENNSESKKRLKNN